MDSEFGLCLRPQPSVGREGTGDGEEEEEEEREVWRWEVVYEHSRQPRGLISWFAWVGRGVLERPSDFHRGW